MLVTIGFSNHQKRSDRDKYIAIHRENVNCTDEFFIRNFAKEIESDARIKYLTPFDYESVTLYSEYDFSINRKPVLTSKIKSAKIKPSQTALSKFDKILLNRFYECESVDKRKSSIFYEDEFGLRDPPVINYHEIERAKMYLFNDVVTVNEKDQKIDDDEGVDVEGNLVDTGDEEGTIRGKQIRKKRSTLASMEEHVIGNHRSLLHKSLMKRKPEREARKQRRDHIRSLRKFKSMDW